MEREIDMKEVSDGRLYTSNDLVKADCGGCEGCSSCCTGMGSSITLDPLDVFRLCAATGKDFESLLDRQIELNIVDGMILPDLKMDSARDACPFLDGQGRCSIHSWRPGICRLFPLGRYYEENGFKYFIQIHECSRQDRGKIKIKKWLGIPNLKAYEEYILEWHRFLGQCGEALDTLSEENVRILTLYVLRRFYETAYLAADENGFYEEFAARLGEVREKFGF